MTVLAYVDALLDDVLPDLVRVTKDRSATQPFRAQPDRLYLWPRTLAPQRLEEANGRWIEAVLHLRAAVTVSAKGEPRVLAPDRGASERLDDAVDAIVAAVAANRRRDGMWWDLYVAAIGYDSIRTVDVRGHTVDLVVRIPDPPGPLGEGS